MVAGKGNAIGSCAEEHGIECEKREFSDKTILLTNTSNHDIFVKKCSFVKFF